MTAERLHLLPSNSTRFERAVSETLDRTPEIAPGIDALHAFKFRQPNDSILPWIVVEYGLGPVTPYLPNLATVIEYGIRWQRVKGIPQAIVEAMRWIGYAPDQIYEAPTRRTRWHLFEIDFDRFWEREADLNIVEAVVSMSGPARSYCWRGYEQYNVREHEWGYSAWGNAVWGDCSGVRLHAGGMKWSFGRTHEPAGGVYDFTQAALTALGVWIAPVAGGLSWGPFPWTTPNLTWIDEGAETRAAVIATGLLAKTCWIAIHRADGSRIGCRRARAFHAVVPAFGGRYRVNGVDFEPVENGRPRLYVEAMTDFGEGDGEKPASWRVVIGAALPPGAKPGVQWLAGNQLVGGTSVGSFPVATGIVFGKTARERFRAILRIV